MGEIFDNNDLFNDLQITEKFPTRESDRKCGVGEIRNIV